MSGTGPGQAVQGFIANPGSSFNPVDDGYPTDNPTTGFTPLNEGFAGIILGNLVGGGRLDLYCIDIRTATFGGIGYEEGSWEASNVANVGYVARILNRYIPEDPTRPAGLTRQSARRSGPSRDLVLHRQVRVEHQRPSARHRGGDHDCGHSGGTAAGAPPPTLNISPFADSAPAGQTAGPFIVNSGVVSPTVTATGATMYSDPAGTLPIANGSTVPNGQQIWLKSDTAGPATLSATATATYPTGNVYLYDHNTAGVNDAQRLIIAEQSTSTTTVKAVATFQAPGSLVVNKNISGPAAGSQGEVRIAVNCGAAAPACPTSSFRPERPLHNSAHLSRHTGRQRLHGHRDRRRAHRDGAGHRDR